MTREQYVLSLDHSEPESVEAGVREARNSPVEQSGDEPGRVATDTTPTSGPTESVGL
jgi:hypothetical protein